MLSARVGVSCTPGWGFPIVKGGIWRCGWGDGCSKLLPLSPALQFLRCSSVPQCPSSPPVTTGPFHPRPSPYSVFTQPEMDSTGTGHPPPPSRRGSPWIHLHSGTPKCPYAPRGAHIIWWGWGMGLGGHWTVVSMLVGACGTSEPGPYPGITFPPGTASQFAGGRCSQTWPTAATVRGDSKSSGWGTLGWDGDTVFPPGEHSGGALGAQDPPAPQAELRHGQGSCTAAARRGAAPGRAPPDRTSPGRAPHGRAPLPGPGTAGAAPAPHDAAAAPPGRHSAGRIWILPPGTWGWGQGKRWMGIGTGTGWAGVRMGMGM